MSKLLRAVHANRGIEQRYRKSMTALIDEMNASVEYWLTVAYRKQPPRMAALVDQAQDASPTREIQQVLRDLARRWIGRFDDNAQKIADAYVSGMFKATDNAFRAALRDAGWSVNFKMTRAMQDALNATIAENVSLISSIPEQYLQQVEGVVMRAYASGRDLQTMVTELRDLYPISKRRAALIARDQSNKANSVVNRARQLELGLTDAVWMHSHAGKTPRPSHVAANGKRYKIAEGCLIDGEYVQPGEKINCRCTSRVVLPI